MVTSELTNAAPNCPIAHCRGGLYFDRNLGMYLCFKCGYASKVVPGQQVGSSQNETVVRAPNVGAAGPLPAEIPRWSWAAFIFNWIWALARGLWFWGFGLLLVYFLAFITAWIPIVGILVSIPLSFAGLAGCFVLGFKGNVLDWRHGSYTSTNAFRKSHRRWFIAMKIILWIFIVEGIFLFAVLVFRFFSALSGS